MALIFTSSQGSGCVKHSMFAGVCLLALIVLAGCQTQVVAVDNPPGSLEGTWEGHFRTSPILLRFSQDGEFRMAANADWLFESPWVVGRYQYHAGIITFYNGGVQTEECRFEGHYAVVAYTAGDSPEITIQRQEDRCLARSDILHDSQWVLPAGDG